MQTPIQIAVNANKHKALLVILDILRQRRELATAIDVTDDEGRTPLMVAAAKGFATCVDLLVYYGAQPERRSRAGKTAEEYAVRVWEWEGG